MVSKIHSRIQFQVNLKQDFNRKMRKLHILGINMSQYQSCLQ